MEQIPVEPPVGHCGCRVLVGRVHLPPCLTMGSRETTGKIPPPVLARMGNSGNSVTPLPSPTHLTPRLRKTSSKVFPRGEFSLFHTQTHQNSTSWGQTLLIQGKSCQPDSRGRGSHDCRNYLWSFLSKMKFSFTPFLIISQTSRKNQPRLCHQALVEGSYGGSTTPG